VSQHGRVFPFSFLIHVISYLEKKQRNLVLFQLLLISNLCPDNVLNAILATCVELFLQFRILCCSK